MTDIPLLDSGLPGSHFPVKDHPKGHISALWTVFCGCGHWIGHEDTKRDAGYLARRCGWKLTRRSGWRCPHCQSLTSDKEAISK